MARGNTKREGRAARSELPSGVEATQKDVQALAGQVARQKDTERYAANFEKWAEYSSFGKVNFGDGQVGNGIIENGVLVLRDEDIEKIVSENFGDGHQQVLGLIEDGGGEQPFALFVGDNNKIDNTSSTEQAEYFKKSATLFNNELGSSPIELPSGDDYEITDFQPRERETRDYPGADAQGTITIGRGETPSNRLQVAYEKVTGLRVSLDSMLELAIALDNKIDQAARFFEDKKESNFDWDDYGDTDDRDHEEDYDEGQ